MSFYGPKYIYVRLWVHNFFTNSLKSSQYTEKIGKQMGKILKLWQIYYLHKEYFGQFQLTAGIGG